MEKFGDLTGLRNVADGGGKRCGWVCRRLRGVANFVRDIPVLGRGIANKLDAVADIMSEIDTAIWGEESRLIPTALVYDPTQYEERILNTWDTQKFTPFYKALAIELTTGMQSQTLASQLVTANNILSKMCLVDAYYRVYETNGLSQKGVEVRSNFIINAFDPLYTIIEDTFANVDVETLSKVNSLGAYQFQYLNIANVQLSVNCEVFSIPTGTQSGVPNAPVPPIVDSPPKPVVTTPIPINTSPKPATGNNSNQQQVVVKKDNTLVWIGIAIASAIVLAIPDDDKKK